MENFYDGDIKSRLSYYKDETRVIPLDDKDLSNTLDSNPPSGYLWKRTDDGVDVEVGWNAEKNMFEVLDESNNLDSYTYFEFYQKHTFRKNKKKFDADGKPEIGFILILNASRLIHLREQSGHIPVKLDKNKAIEDYVGERYDDMKYAIKNTDVDFIDEKIRECLCS